MKQSIVQEAFRHPYLHAMTCDTCYGVRFQRLSAVREKEGNNRGSMTDMPQFLTQIGIQYSFPSMVLLLVFAFEFVKALINYFICSTNISLGVVLWGSS